MAEDLEDRIRESAAGPKRAKGDSAEMEQHPLRDLIEADRYLSSKQAARATGLGVRRSKLVPPGAD